MTEIENHLNFVMQDEIFPQIVAKINQTINETNLHSTVSNFEFENLRSVSKIIFNDKLDSFFHDFTPDLSFGHLFSLNTFLNRARNNQLAVSGPMKKVLTPTLLSALILNQLELKNAYFLSLSLGGYLSYKFVIKNEKLLANELKSQAFMHFQPQLENLIQNKLFEMLNRIKKLF